MAVTKCELVNNSLRLSGREFVYSARFRITSDTRNMAAYDVLNGATSSTPNPFPSYFATYSLLGDSDPSAFMQEVDIQQIDDNNTSVWMATATWSPIKGADNADGHTSRQNPLLRPTIYSREWEEISIPVERGWNEQALNGIGRAADTLGPIQNAAGQEPSTPIMKTKRIPVIVAEKNYANLAAIDAIETTFGDSLNDATYQGYAAGECLFRGISASRPKYEGGTEYYTGTIRIACQKGGWSYEMVNRGFKFLDGGELKEATIKDTLGQEVPVTEPVNLELDGSRTADGAVGTVINYRHRPEVDFSTIGV